MPTRPVPISLLRLDALDRDAFVAALGHLFERSPWVVAETYRKGPFRTTGRLLADLGATLRAAPRERQIELIRAHPDLAGRLARPADLTEESQREQASAGLNALSAEETRALERSNAAYRERFGFPFVICARLNDRQGILSALRRRLEHGQEEEIQAALAEIEKIAELRLRDVLAEEAE